MSDVDAALRFCSLDALADKTATAYDRPGLLDTELQYQRVHNTYGVIPTIGCEVEVKWSSLFPELATEYFGEKDEYGRFERRYIDLPYARRTQLDAVCKSLDNIILPQYEHTVQVGIPKGGDAYWEFANAPVFSSNTLVAEVDLLVAGGLIPASAEHSLHVTLGGLAPGKGGIGLLGCGLELVGSSEQRIMQVVAGPKRHGNTGWALKSDDGVRKRGESELGLDQTLGSEIRTLSLSPTQPLHVTLKWGQMLGSTLLAYRFSRNSEHPVVQQLVKLWPQYRTIIKNLLEAKGLPSEKGWGQPGYHQERWQTWAESIGRTAITGSLEQRTTSKIDEIVQTAEELINKL